MNEYELICRNYTLEINRLIKAYKFSYDDRTVIHICTYDYNKNTYCFFIFEEESETGIGNNKVEFSDLYPLDFVFGDRSKCIIYECISNQLDNLNTIKIAEFRGRDFNIIKSPHYLDLLIINLYKLHRDILSISLGLINRKVTEMELKDLKSEILKIEKLISHEYEISVCECFVSI